MLYLKDKNEVCTPHFTENSINVVTRTETAENSPTFNKRLDERSIVKGKMMKLNRHFSLQHSTRPQRFKPISPYGNIYTYTNPQSLFGNKLPLFGVKQFIIILYL